MKALSISGGSTKILGFYGLLEDLEYNPDIIIGVSAGAILSLPIACNKLKSETFRNILFNLKYSHFFDKSPVKENGEFRWTSLLRIIMGKKSLGTQNNLVKTLKSIISQEDYSNFLISGKIVYVTCVDLKTGKPKYFKLNNYKYEDALILINASASIPIFTEPVKFGKYELVDGGLRDHNASHYILKKYQITKLISLYSRPKDHVLSYVRTFNILSILERVIDTMSLEISINDEMLESELCLKNNIEYKAFHLPLLTKSLYDINKERLYKLYLSGKIITESWKK
jgi:predicted acylesterase/phospholipase RssA